ncbi:hypothetical protein Anacy_3810 [Anabaena cylindrica PCC 7122]|uniref:Uncharacterized protein n=1 Tax=Anabaena cylindrica (strain ATCC 27899 / PCC 7122) TaxID=272123 RepID=K9ZJ20_ANACC|nr:hypothetical protein Anacy_3810 [Anabaena cylindrica PCC 7122]BAY03782.1 hypothetical protein NIES19_30380 [Anabaena cylindrica PCC 7122]
MLNSNHTLNSTVCVDKIACFNSNLNSEIFHSTDVRCVDCKYIKLSIKGIEADEIEQESSDHISYSFR